MPRSKLGSVVHSVTSRDGSFTFRATDEWEATEIAPGGYEGAKEVIPEKWLDRYPHVFVQGAVFRSWHEQSGKCIWGGRLRETPSRNGGRADLAIQGWAQLADRNAGRLLYQSRDLAAWREFSFTSTAPAWDTAVETFELVARRQRQTVAEDPITLATAAAADDIVDTATAHGFSANDQVVFTALTGGAGLTVGTEYYVRSANLGATTFEVSAFQGGAKVNFTTDITAGSVVKRLVFPDDWERAFIFRTPGTSQITRFAAEVETNPHYKGACVLGVWGHRPSDAYMWGIDAFVLNESTPFLELDLSVSDTLSGDTDAPEEIWLTFGTLVDTDGTLAGKYGAWPAFRPSNITNDYESWSDPISVALQEIRVNGIAPEDYFSTSSVVRDIATRLGISDHEVDDLGLNALPLDVRDGMTYGEALDHVSVLSNARWLIHDTGTRRYMDFGKFNKRVWTASDPHQDIDLLPLERFDRVVIPYRVNDGKSIGTVTVVADPNPLDYPNSFGRIRLNDEVRVDNDWYGYSEDAARVIGERLVDHLAKQRWGGSGFLSHVQDHNGVSQSVYFLHAGDVLRVPHRKARARIARKSMTTRGVSVDFEDNYAPLDRMLARRAKRMERV